MICVIGDDDDVRIGNNNFQINQRLVSCLSRFVSWFVSVDDDVSMLLLIMMSRDDSLFQL